MTITSGFVAQAFVIGGEVIGDAVMNDRNARPEPDPAAAPHGWTWDRSVGRWRPARKRGNYARGNKATPAADPAADTAADPGQDPDQGKDPDPGWYNPEPPPEPQPWSGSIKDVPREVVNDIAGFAGLVGAPVLAMLQAADPYCGSILAQNFEPIIDATLPLLCRSEKIVAYFTGDKSDWLLWGKLAMALAPVARAVLDHHVLRTIDVIKDPNTGQIQVVRRQRGGSEMGDHLQPPQAQPDYSRYAA